MTTLKVLPLEWYMKAEREELIEDGYREIPPVVGRDGFYCQHPHVWFEHDGHAFEAFKGETRTYAVNYFRYMLTVTDEKILSEREAGLLEETLRVTTDKGVRKAISARLELHHDALSTRKSYRHGRALAMRVIRKAEKRLGAKTTAIV